jgi:uridine kinase
MTPERNRTLAILARRILEIERRHPVRVAIDGPDAAGKTTLADELAEIVRHSGRPVIRASIDDFHRPRTDRYARGEDSPAGYFLDSFDNEALRAHLLDPLGPGGGGTFRRRVFDFLADRPVISAPERTAPDSLLLFDGVFLLRDELADCWDFSIFVAVPFSETLRRASERDVELFGSAEKTRRRYEIRYIPGQQRYLRSADPRSRATVVMDNADPDRPQLIWP